MGTFFGTADAYSHYLRELGHDCARSRRQLRAFAAGVGARARARRRVLGTVLLAQVEDFRARCRLPAEPSLPDRHDDGCATAQQRARAGRSRALPRPISGFACSTFCSPRFRTSSSGSRARASRPSTSGSASIRASSSRSATSPTEHDVVFVGALNGIRHRRGNASDRVRGSPADPSTCGATTFGLAHAVVPASGSLPRRGLGDRHVPHPCLVEDRPQPSHHGRAPTANNMRLYEATGVGSLLSPTPRRISRDLFEPGREVVTYRSGRRARRAGSALPRHDEDARREIAAAGQARTLRDHTYCRPHAGARRDPREHRP